MKQIGIYCLVAVAFIQYAIGQETQQSLELTDEQKQEIELHKKMQEKAKAMYPNRFNLKPAKQNSLQKGTYTLKTVAPQKNVFSSADAGSTSAQSFTYEFTDRSQVKHFKDSPDERDKFELLRTKDPRTGIIPIDIRKKELTFMRDQARKLGVPFESGDLLTSWTNRGPHNVGGRTRALAVDINDENIILAGGVSGGMWRSTDQGVSWTKTTGSNELQSVSCVAQDPTNPTTWYYGTGEIRGNSASDPGASYRGDGFYKSTDNGVTWTILASTSTDVPELFDQVFDYNHEVVVNPTNGDVLVANFGGIYLSTDGGDSFSNVLSMGGGQWSDIVISSAGKAYAVIDDRGVFSSTDGVNWADITPASGLTLYAYERKELALAPSNENILYLLGQDGDAGSGHSLWKYDDSSGVWEDRSGSIPQLGGLTGNFDTQGGYDQLIKVKPDDENFVIIGGTNLFASTDGFSSTANTHWIGGYTATNESYALYTNHHPDQHSFVFLSNNRAISGNDGGVQITEDITEFDTNNLLETVDWITLNNGYLTTQVYAVSAGPEDQVMAGFQDNSTWLTISTDSDIDWTDQFGGDGAYSDFSNDGTVRYLSSQFGNIYRINYGSSDDITADGFTYFTPAGYSAQLFIVPFYLDPINDDLFYLAGSQSLYVNTQSSTGSSSLGWTTIDLGAAGIVSEFGVTESNVVYVGTSAGEVFKVTDAGGSPSVTDITGSNFPGGYVSGIAANQFDPNELLVTFSNYSIPSVFYSTDGGTTWTDVSGSLEENPDGSGSGPSLRTANILGNGDRYFVGTSTGLYSATSISEGMTWAQENPNGIGEVVVDHLVGRNSDGLLVAGTHGNGIYSAQYEVSGQRGDDLAATAILSPEELVSGEESITVAISNPGLNPQSGFDITYAVNGSDVSTETFSGTIESQENAEFTFSQTYDFSDLGEYEVTATVVLANDELASNNSVSKTVVNAEFLGNYLMTQSAPTTEGISTAFSNGYLFHPSGQGVVSIGYGDTDTRILYLNYYHPLERPEVPYSVTIANGEVIFGADQGTGVACEASILLGPGSTPGSYTDDSGFTMTLTENTGLDCDLGSNEVTFELIRQLENDLALTRIVSPQSEIVVGENEVVVEVWNAGMTEKSGFELSYSVNGEVIATETFEEVIGSNEYIYYVFAQTYEFGEGTFTVDATLTDASDENTDNNSVSRTVESSTLTGFEGPYLLEQLNMIPSDASTAGAFGGGYIFDNGGLSNVYIQDIGEGRRIFTAQYINFGTFVDYTFTLTQGGTIFDNGQNTGWRCDLGIELGTADAAGSVDLTDDNSFYLNIKDNILGDCSFGSYDGEFLLTKLPEMHDMAALDIINPPYQFYAGERTIEAYIYNYGNVPESDFEVTYTINGVEVSQTVEEEVFPNQGVVVTFDTPYDFSEPDIYDITITVNLPDDEFTDNDSFVTSVESYPAIAEFPYAEDFEIGYYPLGFEGSWNIQLGGSAPTSTGPNGDHTTGDGYYAFADLYGTYQQFESILSREIDLTSLSTPALSFYYHMFGTTNASLRVFIIDQDGLRTEVFRLEGEEQGVASDDYKQAVVNLGRYTDDIVRVEFEARVSEDGVPAQIAIDDIGISEAYTHDLAVTEITSPLGGEVSGEEHVAVTVYNPGASAELNFDVSLYVNDEWVATEVFSEVIISGQRQEFAFETPYDFSATGLYEVKVEVSLPADEFAGNNSVEGAFQNGLPFTGLYQLFQPDLTQTGPSFAFSGGYLFGSENPRSVFLEYVDEVTRKVSLTYLPEYGTPTLDYYMTFDNGEVYFNPDQYSGIGCTADGIILTTSSSAGFSDEDGSYATFFILEDPNDDCGAGTGEVQFELARSIQNDLRIISINLADVIPSAQHFVNYSIENIGSFDQEVFEVAYYVDDVFVASHEINQVIPPFQSRSYSFDMPFNFSTIDAYNVKVEIIRANDENEANNSLEKLIQTSGFVVNATPISNGNIGVEWNSLISATSFVLERTEADGTLTEIATLSGSDTHYIDDTADPSLEYGYRLLATLEGGTTTYSDMVYTSASIEEDYMFGKVLGDISGVDLPNWSYGNSWADLDDDGDLDMIVSNVPNFDGSLFLADQPYVYLNDGTGRFEKVEDVSLVSEGTSTRSTAIIDFDNDGLKDVFMPQLNSSSDDLDDRLFKNNGSMDFQRVNVPELSKNHSNEQSVWGDMDNDGDLDLIVAGIFATYKPDFLFRNNGDGTFESIREGTIYDNLYGSDVFAWTASWVDFDNDGDMDLYIPNNRGTEGEGDGARMFRNAGDGTFEVVTDNILVDEKYSVRGAHWADVDQDGWMDLIMVPVNGAPIFYFNDGNEDFTKVESATAFGEELVIHRISTIGDLDNNGKQELIFASDGFFVYESNNDRTFTKVENVFPPIMGGIFAGMSLGDMDGDGDLDLFRGNGGSGYPHNVLYENKGNSNNWIQFSLAGEFSNADGIGAKVVVYANEGVAQYRTVNAISGLISQGSLIAEFGLGSAAVVDSVKIYWPSGTVKELYNVAVNQLVEVDDSNAPTDVGLSNASIPEGLNSGSPIGASFSVDLDAEDGHTYEIVTGTGGIVGGANLYAEREGPFKTDKYSPVRYQLEGEVSANERLAALDGENFTIENGTLKASTTFDFEDQSSYTIQVRSTDSFGNTFDKLLNIEILDVNEDIENEAPTDIGLSAQSINENEPVSSVLGTLSSVDADEDNTHTYSLVDGDANTFSIDGDQLLIAESFNFEKETSYTITVRTIDNHGKSFDKEFTIRVENVNEDPLELSLDNTEIDEEQVVGTLVGLLSTEDTDNDDEHTYELSGADAAAFQIVGNELLAAEQFNFEAKSEFEITVTTTDAGGLSIADDYTIVVNDINDVPSGLALSASAIEEGLVSGLLIGKLSTTDDDEDDGHTYALTGEDAESFQIVLDELRTGATFNFEERSSYEIGVITTDDGGLSYEEQVTISILDVNDVPFNLAISSNQAVEEQAVGFLVGAFSVSDEDTNDSHIYELVSGDGDVNNASFTVDEGSLYTDEQLDFETAETLSVRIAATDAAGAFVEDVFEIEVIDVDEANPNSSPTAIALSGNEIQENSAVGSSIGSFTSTDPDVDNTHTYSLVSGSTSSFTIDDDVLKSNETFNFEEVAQFTITVRTVDNGGLYFDEEFTILVTNENEAPSALYLSETGVSEGEAVGTVIGALSTEDDDSGDSHTYTVTGENAAFFGVSGSDLVTNEVLDFESQSAYELTIVSTDNDGLSIEELVTIEVGDVNEAPFDLAIDNNSLGELAAVGSTVGTISVSDQDAGDSHSYTLSGADAESFVVVIDELRSNTAFNFEEKATYTIAITATDANGLTTSEDVTISIDDLNDAPTSIAISAVEIEENSGAGAMVANISVEDEDAGDSHTYELSGSDATSFTISNSNEISTTVDFNFESKAEYAFSVTATDSGGESIVEDFVVAVTDANDAPTNLALDGNTIVEGTAANTAIGLLSFDDEDASDTHTYALGGVDAAKFVIEGNELKNTEVFNFEEQATMAFSVTVTDAGGLSTSSDYEVAVSDANDVPTDIVLANSSIDENSGAGARVGAISVVDEDVSDTHTYELSGTDATSFTISESNELETSSDFDFEEKAQYEITINATDGGGESISKNFIVAVADVNESPSAIALEGSTIEEGSDTGTSIGTLTVTDPDADESFTFSITGDGASNFEVVDGVLTNAAVLDFDDAASYTITIEAADKGGLTVADAFTITVTQVVLSLGDPASIVKVYPNPSNGSFTLEMGSAIQNTEWKMFDLSGKELKVGGRILDRSKGLIEIDARALEDGEYVLVLSNADNQISTQIIIRK